MNNRLQQKHDLFVKLGELFGPLKRMIDHPEQYDEQENAETVARYFAEYLCLIKEFQTFSLGQVGHNYAIQHHKFFYALDGVKNQLTHGSHLKDVVPAALATAYNAIDAIPVPRTSVILEAGSPFTAYCRLRELCEVDATSSLCWLDPYFDENIFPRYIANIRPSVPVTLVTCGPNTHSPKRDQARWTAFLDVSRLYAQERGPSLYRLVVQPTLHDRWVIFDEKRIYVLGGSAKDAANRDDFTITGIEASAANFQSIQSHINTGTEFFGPSTPTHA